MCLFSFGFKADGERPFSQGQTMDQDQGWRKRQYDEMGGGEGRVIEGSDGDKMARDARATFDDQQDEGDEMT